MAYEGEARSPRAVDWPIALASKALDQAQRLFDSPRSLQLDQEDSNAERPQIQRLEQAVLITADVQFQELDLLIAEPSIRETRLRGRSLPLGWVSLSGRLS